MFLRLEVRRGDWGIIYCMAGLIGWKGIGSTLIVLHKLGRNDHCEWDFDRYKAKWDFVVKRSSFTIQGRSGYFIESMDGELYNFYQYQTVLSEADPGDRIIKNKYSKWCSIISEHDTSISRIDNEICDRYIDSLMIEYKDHKKISD